ncbi:acyltransferase [Aggregatilinea lenta]|uniref:acyltransferase n=1 Tax=Aggregatilinea lenta TaxID=913108 RepID=UPI0013C2D843|nr:acyltransferase [Aggregatilinea lenta]
MANLDYLQFDTPWKLLNELQRLALLPLVRYTFMSAQIAWGTGWKIYGIPIIQRCRYSTIVFGANLQLRSTARSNPLGPNRPVIICTLRRGANLIIGDSFGMSGGSIVAQTGIHIGQRVAVGANTIICDTDFHPLFPEMRRTVSDQGEAAPIEIEDDVFVGMQCLILKGVTIGCGSVIGAGSVVTKSLPPRVIAAGNPARVIREI